MKKINYYEKLSELEIAVVNEITDELKRIGRNFSIEKDEDIEFFRFEKSYQEGASELVLEDGMARIKFDDGDNVSLHKCMGDAVFILADVISLLNQLREIKPKKKK
jgi:hypothetical protein